MRDGDVKRITLFLFGGEELACVAQELPDVEENSWYEAVVAALNWHFSPSANPDRARYNVRRAMQMQRESLEQFHRRVRRLVHLCGDIDRESEVRAQIIAGCRSDRLRHMIFRQPGISLRDILELGRFHEEEAECPSTPLGWEEEDPEARVATRVVPSGWTSHGRGDRGVRDEEGRTPGDEGTGMQRGGESRALMRSRVCRREAH